MSQPQPAPSERSERAAGGRPSTLDETDQGIATIALAAGLSLREAATWVGIPHAKLYHLIHHDTRVAEDLEYYSEMARLHPHLCVYRVTEQSWQAAVCLLKVLERRHGGLTTDRLYEALELAVSHAFQSGYD